jgi:hypothetical protein
MRRTLAVATAFVGLLMVWQFLPPQTPALYDGICSPDPYRYVVDNPAGVPAPSPVSMTYPLASGQVPTIQTIADDDNDPQAQILILAGSIKVPPGTQAIKVSITAEAPPSIKPRGGYVDGNVYEFQITTGTGAPVVLFESPTIVLRGTSTTAVSRTLQQFNGTTWKALKSSSLGCADTLEAPAITLGEFAIVGSGSTAPSHAEPSGSSPWGLIEIALALLAFGSLLAWASRKMKAR